VVVNLAESSRVVERHVAEAIACRGLS